MQSVYSFYGSRLHLILEDEVAERYNRFLECWYEAQHNHHQYHEKPWKPLTTLSIKCDPEDVKVFNQIGEIINKLGEINGGGLNIPEEEMTEEGLIKVE